MKKLSNLGRILSKLEQKAINGGNLPEPIGEEEDCIVASGIVCTLSSPFNECRNNEICVQDDDLTTDPRGATNGDPLFSIYGTCVCEH